MSSSSSVCGFSFGRNLTQLNYPVEAAVRSVLPICDRFVFAVGESDDDTRERVAAIDQRVEIVDTTWPDVQIDGTVLAIEANKALEAAEATGCTWGFYIQADEVVHEDDREILTAAMDHWADTPEVKALLLRFLHFMLDYRTVDPWMYHKASRVVRLDGTCEIFGDACGPGLKEPTPEVLKINDGYLDKNHLGSYVRWAKHPDHGLLARPARIFHYGWVKTPEQLEEKMKMVEQLWWGTLDDQQTEQRRDAKFGNMVKRYPILKRFNGTHPETMAERVDAHDGFRETLNRWLNPRFYAEVLRHGFHG